MYLFKLFIHNSTTSFRNIEIFKFKKAYLLGSHIFVKRAWFPLIEFVNYFPKDYLFSKLYLQLFEADVGWVVKTQMKCF